MSGVQSNKGQKKIVFSDAEDAYLKAHYGLHHATAIGAAIGRSVDAIKRRARKLGLSKPRRFTNARPRRVDCLDPGAPQPSDASLIAAYLATKAVTQLAPGQAAGLTSLERDLHAAPANTSGLSWRQRNHLEITAMLLRRKKP